MNRTLCSIAILGFLSTASAIAQESPDWAQWRGPTRDGQFRGPAWPASLTKDNFRKIWRVPLGPSYSGPIVTADRVFTTETKNAENEIVRAIDRATGKQIWERSWPGAMTVPFFARANGDWIRSTPAYDGERLYVGGMRDVLVCLDAKTGGIVWKVDFVESLKSSLPTFGFVSSPLLDGDHVYVQAGGAFSKLDKRSGKLVWQTLKDGGAMMGSAFSSPTFAELRGRRQILVQTRSTLAGVDPAAGDVLWSVRIPAFREMNILTPALFGDAVFTSAYGDKSSLIVLSGETNKLKADKAWTNKHQGYMSSPIIHDGHAYMHLRSQNLTCIDLKDGTSKWTTSERFGQYWSMVAQKDRILALDDRGILYLMRANPNKYEPIAELPISDQPTWAHLAMSGRNVFVRELKGLTAYEWTDGPADRSP